MRKLKDAILKANTGLDAIQRAPIVDYNTGIKCLRIQDVSHNNEIEYWGFTEVSDNNFNNFQLKPHDIIISRTGGSIGTSMYINKKLTSVYNNGLIKLNVSDTYNSKFIYYTLQLNAFKKYIVQISGGNSTQENIRIQDLLDYNIPNRSCSEQKQIADILSTLDNKIELNNKINIELEAMAKTIYDYWFVQFDFPDTNGKPYKSSGGAMVWNEELKREIPEGWGVGTFNNYIRSEKGGDWGKDTQEGNYTYNINCIRGTDFPALRTANLCEAPERYILKNNSFKKLDTGDIIIEISGGSPTQSTGRICYINNNSKKRFSRDIITSNFCKAITLKKASYLYLFYLKWNRLYDFGIFFNYESKTTGIKNLLFDNFVSSYAIPIPNEEIIEQFNNIASNIFETIQHNALENMKLSELRDWLLPMLMNGQVTVKDAEEIVDEAVSEEKVSA